VTASVATIVRKLVARQRRLDQERGKMADEIIAGQSAVAATVDDWKMFARAWIITAVQEAANAAYWRKRAEDLQRQLRQMGAKVT